MAKAPIGEVDRDDLHRHQWLWDAAHRGGGNAIAASENFPELDAAFSLALLDCFALAVDSDRRMLAEIFGRPGMTAADVAATRRAIRVRFW